MAQTKANRVFQVWNQYPAFKLLQYSGLLTALTGWASSIAMLILLDQITDNGVQLGTLWAVSGLAPLAFSLLVGVWVDRVDIKRGLIVVEILRALLVLAFLWLPHLHGWSAWSLYFVLRFVLANCGSFSFTARATVIPQIVSREDLTTANSLNFTLMSIIRLSGASLGGVLVALFGLDLMWIITALSFVVSAFLIGRARWETQARMKVESSYLADMREGFRVARENSWVRLVLLLTLASGMVAGTFTLMIQQFVENVYRLPDSGMSLLYIAEGTVSAFVGIYIANKNFSLQKNSSYGWFYLLYGLSWVLFGFTSTLWGGMLCLVLFAFSVSVTIPFERYTMQVEVPAELRGRVFGLWNTLTSAMMQLGAFAAGLLMTYSGIASVPIATGALEMLAGLGFLLFVRWKLEARDGAAAERRVTS